MYILLVLLTACLPNPFNRDKFENAWWELQEYPICFNIHKTGDLLTYEGHIQNLGPWDYKDNGEYYIEDEDVTLTVMPYINCWTITGYMYYNVTACECTLRD
jgi:hypothetical protein